jgi:hypothetical protein
MMNPQGPMPPTMHQGPMPPAPGGGTQTESMYQQRLAQIKAMPPGPQQEAALMALSRDYEGEQTAARDQMRYGNEAAMQGGSDPMKTGGRFGTTVARNPLEHMADGLRTYKGYKDMSEAQDVMKSGSDDKQRALIAMLRAAL